MPDRPRVLIIGGGFAGLSATQRLAHHDVAITLIDRTNHHLFQPLLYQVATGGLSPANIAVPLRSLFRRHRNVSVVQDSVEALSLATNSVRSQGAVYPFDYLVVAAGGRTVYYGHDEWESAAPGLKTLSDATEIRGRVLSALEASEANQSMGLPTFVIAGGGPTGVEMSGAIAELTRQTLRREFRRIDPAGARILLVDPGERLLSSYPEELSEKAAHRLKELGIEIRLGESLRQATPGTVVIGDEERSESLEHAVVVWAAGVAGSPLGKTLAEQAGVDLGRGGRVPVQNDLSLPKHPQVFVAGDLANCRDADGTVVPGVAPAAIQQGKHVADTILRRMRGKKPKAFAYRDYGAMAVIGRGAAVADLRGWRLSGYSAWLAWLFIHLLQLVGYQNRLLVACQWAWNYFTRNRSARLITTAPRPANDRDAPEEKEPPACAEGSF